MQKITSANTSIKQVPALHKSGTVRQHLCNSPVKPVVLDIGAGKYPELAEQSLRNVRDICYYPVDKYNLSDTTNAIGNLIIAHGTANIVLCSNVLNVIDDDDAMNDVIMSAASATRNTGGTAYFHVYEGDKSKIGKVTSKGYQRNAPTQDYMRHIETWFAHVERRGRIIIAAN